MANWLDKTFHSIDYNVAKFFHLIEANCGKPMTWFMKFVSYLGEMGLVMIAISLILCIFPRTRRIGATALLAIAIGALFTSIILKPLIERARPYTNLDSNFYRWWQNAGQTVEEDFSFPSGHTTATMAFALSIFLATKKKRYSFPILLFPIFMASSRIYLMVHYFSDCIGGVIVGTISTVIAFYLCKLLFEKTKGKFNNFINNFKIQDLFKHKKSIKTENNNSENNLNNN